MAVEIRIPTMGESITSGVLGSWRKANGQYVKEGEALFEIETDKVTSEIYAEASGLLTRLVDEGVEVKIGEVVARIDETAAPPPSESSSEAPSAVQTSAAKPGLQNGTEEEDSPSSLSPAVRHLVEEHRLDPGKIAGTGKGGRILKSDVLAHLEKHPGGASSSGAAIQPAVIEQASGVSQAPKTSRRMMSQLRRKIADRLVTAQHEAAMLTTFNEVDMTNVIALRKQFQDRFLSKHDIKLGFMSFFVSAAVYALRQVPEVNAQIDGMEMIQNHYYDIGVAISTKRGLLVPVIRGADGLSLAGIEKAIVQYSQKAKEGKISLDDLEGGVFTITNGGIFGSMLSTPIINPPQSAILGMHAIQQRPVAIDGRVEIRPMMYLALSYDHRLVDGKEAVTFLVRIKEFIENPGAGLLEL